jgi:protein involved in polysaccharide export with SLBB domain
MDVVFLRRIAIHGAVMRAGLYPVDPTMTVLDALALAGGARHDGRLDRIRLLREGENAMTIPTTSMQMEELRIRSGDQLMVPEQSWFRRNNMLIATGISAAASLAIALLYISRG